MKKTVCLVIFTFTAYYASSQGLLFELQQLYQFDRLPQYREGTVKQFSSYDRTGGNDDGFSGKYSFIRMEGENQVIAEMEGPGVINRIWTPTPANDTIEFYFDGEEKPGLSLPFIDLFTSNEFPFLNPICGHEIGGYYCYLPIPYNKSCKVVFKGKMLFYQLQYRTYPGNAKIRSFNHDWNENELAALQQAVNVWSKYGTNRLDELYDDFKVITTKVNIGPGNNKPVFEMKNGGRIIGIEIEGLDKLDIDDNRPVIRAKWDNDQNWAMNTPLKDLFGYYFGEKSMRSLLGGSSGNLSYFYYPMPFSENALVEIAIPESEIQTFPDMELLVRVFYQEKPKQKNEGKFYVFWHRDKNPESGQPYVIMPEIRGEGHYAGTILYCQGHNTGSTPYFEGDDVATIDGESVIHGTGSEDYFNGGYYDIADRWDMAHSLPSHGCLGYSSPLGRTGAYRHYFSDKLSFRKDFGLTIEHGPVENNIPVDYRSLAFYYTEKANPQNPPPATMKEYPQVNSIRYPVSQLKINSFRNGQLSLVRMVDPNRGRALILEPSNDEVTLVVQFLLDVPSDGQYKLYCSYFRTPSSGRVRIMQRQVPLTDWLDTYSAEETHVNREYIGVVNVVDKKCTVTFHVKGKEAQKFLLSGLYMER